MHEEKNVIVAFLDPNELLEMLTATRTTKRAVKLELFEVWWPWDGNGVQRRQKTNTPLGFGPRCFLGKTTCAINVTVR